MLLQQNTGIPKNLYAMQIMQEKPEGLCGTWGLGVQYSEKMSVILNQKQLNKNGSSFTCVKWLRNT